MVHIRVYSAATMYGDRMAFKETAKINEYIAKTKAGIHAEDQDAIAVLDAATNGRKAQIIGIGDKYVADSGTTHYFIVRKEGE